MFIRPLYYLTIAVIAICMAVANALDINKAFDIVNEGLVTSNKTADAQNTALRDSIEHFIKNDELKRNLSELAISQSEYGKYLIALKLALARRGGGINEETGDVNDPDNIEAVAFLLIENHLGDSLYNRMTALSDQMQHLAVTDYAKKQVALMNIYNLSASDWTKHTFEHVPLSPAITILNKFENDTYEAEQVMLRDILYNSKTLSLKPATAH